jgi:hypothetical protein
VSVALPLTSTCAVKMIGRVAVPAAFSLLPRLTTRYEPPLTPALP